MKKACQVFSVLTFCLFSLASIAQEKRPNILVIFSDDHTEQAISAYGSKLMQTPNIDRIAKEGALFKNVFVTNSICAPSRAVLLTGKYSHVNGLRDNSPRRAFDSNQQQIQRVLSQYNYQTAWIGKWHLNTLPGGFDFWRVLPDQGNYFQPDFVHMNKDTVRHKGYVTNLISDFALEWLDGRDKQKPFFMVVGEKATHRNWMPDPQDLAEFENREFAFPANFNDDYKGRRAAADQDMTIDKTMVLRDDLKMGVDYTRPGMFGRMSPEEKAVYKNYYDKAELEYKKVKDDSVALLKWKYQRYLRDYLATARSMDRNIGRILNYLDSTGLSQNTIVIYTSDQGFYMGEHGWFDKRFMYEESLRTPFVMKYPGKVKPGTVVDGMVVNIDFAPSIIDMAGAKVPEDIQGKSFAPLLAEKPNTKDWRKAMFYHYYEFPQPHHVAPHFGVRTERYKLIRFYGPYDTWELFDLKNDRQELHNLIDDPKMKGMITDLKGQLKSLILEYKDEEALKVFNDSK